MLWLDGDCKANTTATLTKDPIGFAKAKCAKYCSKSVTQGAAECCYNLWLPTLNFINAQQNYSHSFLFRSRWPKQALRGYNISAMVDIESTFVHDIVKLAAKQQGRTSCAKFDNCKYAASVATGGA